MEKTGNVQYSIDIYNGRNQLISSNPFTEVTRFTHQYARFQGDERAFNKTKQTSVTQRCACFSEQSANDNGRRICYS